MYITTSQIRSFKSCRRLYELQYIEKLIPRVTPENFSIGSQYHSLIEKVIKGEFVAENNIPSIMAEKFRDLILPKLPIIKSIEEEFKIEISENKFLVGKIDAIAENNDPIEHKTTSSIIDENYINKLQWDDQVTNYLLALSLITGKLVTKAIYTAIRKPSIRQKQSESIEDYLDRCRAWYDEDTEKKLATFPVTRSKEELADKQNELSYIMDDISSCKKYYRNPAHCSLMGCHYSSICLNYIPEIGSSDFVKKEKVNQELKLIEGE